MFMFPTLIENGQKMYSQFKWKGRNRWYNKQMICADTINWTAEEQSLHACSFGFALTKMDNSVTTAEEMCKQLKIFHVQPELKDFPYQMCDNL